MLSWSEETGIGAEEQVPQLTSLMTADVFF